MDKRTKTSWNEIRDQINEWWDDLGYEEFDAVDGDQEQLVKVLQERYRYMRNLASMEARNHTKDYRPEDGEGRSPAKDIKTSRHTGLHHNGSRESKW